MKKTNKQLEVLEKYNKDSDNLTEREMYLRADVVLQCIRMRERMNMTQTDVAKKIGVTFQQVARFESMSNSPTLTFLCKYAMALGGNINISLNGIQLVAAE